MALVPPLTGGRSRPTLLRRIVRDLSSVLIISGLLLLADAAVTLLWQEPLTAVVALIKRSEIDKRFLSLRPPSPGSLDQRVFEALRSEEQRIAYLARREQTQVRAGDAVGRIVIPRIGASFIFVQGTDTASLEKGPGHYPETALPGLGQTVAIAGHRTTYLAPFRNIDELRPGDTIELRMPYGNFRYSVQLHRIVSPAAWWVVRNVGYDRLVLSACNPLYSAAQRIIVFARLQFMRPSSLIPRFSSSSSGPLLPMRS